MIWLAICCLSVGVVLLSMICELRKRITFLVDTVARLEADAEAADIRNVGRRSLLIAHVNHLRRILNLPHNGDMT